MSLKDYYRLLDVPPHATAEDIKKSFRKLAHQYHPDKNPDNPYAEARFREAQEAYAILNDERQRKRYDEERFFAGMAAQKEPQRLDVGWLVAQSRKLQQHMAQVDSDRMNHRALAGYVLLLLSDAHIAVLLAEKDQAGVQIFLENLLLSIRRLDYRMLLPLVEKLLAASSNDNAIQDRIRFFYRQRRGEHRLEKLTPILVLVIALALCLIMILWHKK